MAKSSEAFRTIAEVAEWLGLQAHVLRFWESKFPQVKPLKRAGGRRYYRPSDMLLIGGIKTLLHDQGMTIRGAQKLMREKGVSYVSDLSPALDSEISGLLDAERATRPEADQETSPTPTEPEQENLPGLNTRDDMAQADPAPGTRCETSSQPSTESVIAPSPSAETASKPMPKAEPSQHSPNPIMPLGTLGRLAKCAALVPERQADVMALRDRLAALGNTDNV